MQRAISLFDRRTAVLVYLAIALPVTLWFVFVIAPFQGPDEAEHFMRAVQLSEGRAAIKMFPATHEAGDILDHQLTKLGGYYEKVGGSAKPWFTAGKEDWREAWAEPLTGQLAPTAFSNTVIYFPTAHLAPALAIALTNTFDHRPLAWLYAGRLACASLAVALFAAAVWLAPEIAMFLIAFALMPRVIFQTSVISADASIIPLAALLTALLVRLAIDRVVSGRLVTGAGVTALLICLGKIAYLPLAILPFLIALVQKGPKDKATLGLLFAAVLSGTSWGLWYVYIHDKTLPISINPTILPAKQMSFVMEKPLHFLQATIRTFNSWTIPKFVKQIVGGDIAGPGDFNQPFAEFPSKASYLLLAMLAAAAVVAPHRLAVRWPPLLAASGVAVASLLLIMLGLYLQNTSYSLDFVDGFQGRYLLPLLILPVPFLPKFDLGKYAGIATIGLLLILTGSSLWASGEMWIRYHEAVQSSDRHLRNSALVNLRYPAVNLKPH